MPALVDMADVDLDVGGKDKMIGLGDLDAGHGRVRGFRDGELGSVRRRCVGWVGGRHVTRSEAVLCPAVADFMEVKRKSTGLQESGAFHAERWVEMQNGPRGPVLHSILAETVSASVELSRYFRPFHLMPSSHFS